MNNLTNQNTTQQTAQAAQISTISWDTIAVTAICSFGVLTNSINIAVFLNPSLKDPTYRFMLIKSVVELFYVFINIFNIFVYCGDLCNSNFTSFAGQIFNLGFSAYFTSCLAIYGILIEIYISLKRLLLIKNKKFLESISPYLVLGCLFIMSIIYYLPVFLVKKINEIPIGFGLKIYLPGTTDFGLSNFGKLVVPLLTGLRIVLTVFCLSAINIFSLIEFKTYLKRKVSIRNSGTTKTGNSMNKDDHETKSNNESWRNVSQSAKSRISEVSTTKKKDHRAILNINLMVLLISTLYIIGSLPYSVYFIISQFISVPFIYSSIAYIAISLAHGSNIFIYYLFNNQYNQIFNAYLKKIFSCSVGS